MAMDESKLTKGQLRKLTALRKSVGDELGEEVFDKWMARQAAAVAPKADPVAARIEGSAGGIRRRPQLQSRPVRLHGAPGPGEGANRVFGVEKYQAELSGAGSG